MGEMEFAPLDSPRSGWRRESRRAQTEVDLRLKFADVPADAGPQDYLLGHDFPWFRRCAPQKTLFVLAPT